MDVNYVKVGQMLEIVDPMDGTRKIVEVVAVHNDKVFGVERDNPGLVIMFGEKDWKII